MGNVWYSHPITAADLASHVARLVGRQLLSVETFEYENWLFRFSDDVLVQTESVWRLLNRAGVKVTSDDHGHQFGLPAPVDASARVMSATAGRTVTGAATAPESGDLLIHFGEDVQLQLFVMSCGYESWRLMAGGTEVLCYGGGRIAELRESDEQLPERDI